LVDVKSRRAYPLFTKQMKRQKKKESKKSAKKKGRGRPTIYGEKIDVISLPEKYLKDTKIDKDIETKFYQI